MAEIYVSTDIEADGPIPGPNSMLSFGSAAYTRRQGFARHLFRQPHDAAGGRGRPRDDGLVAHPARSLGRLPARPAQPGHGHARTTLGG